MPTDFIIRNEHQCISSEWIIDYWTVSLGTKASRHAYWWAHTVHAPAVHRVHTFSIKGHSKDIKLSAVEAEHGLELYSRSRIRVCLCWLWSCGTLLLQWIRVPELLYSRLEKGRKLERKRERKLKMGQTSKSQAFLFLRWVSRLYPIASLSFFILLCLSVSHASPPQLSHYSSQRKVQREEKVIMPGMAAEDCL